MWLKGQSELPGQITEMKSHRRSSEEDTESSAPDKDAEPPESKPQRIGAEPEPRDGQHKGQG